MLLVSHCFDVFSLLSLLSPPHISAVPGGPDIPTSVQFSSADLKYPPATGGPELLNAICDYYKHFYGANITPDNIAIFAGGRPAIYATLSFLHPDVKVLVEEAEYTPYWDVLRLLKREYAIIKSNPENNFRPELSDYLSVLTAKDRKFVMKSNPCNPTGVTWVGDKLKALVDFCCLPGNGGLFDEAYEFFHDTPDCALRFVPNIDTSNIFVISAATKGLQVPGMRVGWVVSSKANTLLFRNFSSLAMGGVARPSQIYVSKLLDLPRVIQSRSAIAKFYGDQRKRYAVLLADLGMELFTGDGGFYHFARLPG